MKFLFDEFQNLLGHKPACRRSAWRSVSIQNTAKIYAHMSVHLRDNDWSERCYKQCNMGDYHPYFDTTPDYLHIAKRAKGVAGIDEKSSSSQNRARSRGRPSQ